MDNSEKEEVDMVEEEKEVAMEVAMEEEEMEEEEMEGVMMEVHYDNSHHMYFHKLN